MKSKLAQLILDVLLFVTLCSIPSFARPVPAWPYEKLVAESDLVAIVEPIENQPATDPFPGYSYGHPTNHFVATNTRFKVAVVFRTKGDTPNQLTLLHFSYATNVLSMD